MSIVTIGEGKTLMRFINNVDEIDKMYACVIFKVTDENTSLNFEKHLSNEERNILVVNAINECDATIKFISKEGINLLIDKLISLRDNTDWDWRL